MRFPRKAFEVYRDANSAGAFSLQILHDANSVVNPGLSRCEFREKPSESAATQFPRRLSSYLNAPICVYTYAYVCLHRYTYVYMYMLHKKKNNVSSPPHTGIH